MTIKQPDHVPYEDATSPTEMHGDCEEAKRNLRVPLPRRAQAITTALSAATPVRVKAPAIAVSDRLAKMADAFFDRA
ncbi:hypothetical protein [Nocardioides jiangxiensis]|uniref:Uncharacterized protein n=1 Tax=Nocardioides jiangxiensis TaxID=3064524 RepID=A0ABT9B370_9ACTN|nr:hypothetical protein [Nocardioides sp. WY-20]MDO7869259.1 hypothetical protein [Nocardioides sp. WY-20]